MTVCGIAKADGVCVMGKCPYFKKCCPAVWDKSGEPMTNEEYLKSCTTEQLAELLLNAIQDCKSCVSGIGLAEKDDMTCPFGGCWDVKDIVEWLKQPHKE